MYRVAPRMEDAEAGTEPPSRHTQAASEKVTMLKRSWGRRSCRMERMAALVCGYGQSKSGDAARHGVCGRSERYLLHLGARHGAADVDYEDDVLRDGGQPSGREEVDKVSVVQLEDKREGGGRAHSHPPLPPSMLSAPPRPQRRQAAPRRTPARSHRAPPAPAGWV